MTEKVTLPKAPKIADDQVYGPLRAQIVDEFIAAGSPEPKHNWLYSRLIEARISAVQVRQQTAREILQQLRRRAELEQGGKNQYTEVVLLNLADDLEAEYEVQP